MKRPLLLPFTPLYAAAVAIKNRAYSSGLLKAKSLEWPVISVGNLSVGGTGKTPLVIRLCEILRDQGFYVDVLSRGYGRTERRTELVNGEGDPRRYGDEPMMIARNAAVPVIVGASRYEAGLRAQSPFPATLRGVHFLDDGFQHRQLKRQVDIVLVRPSDLTDYLLPGGNLREPLSALRRADFLVLREEDAVLEVALREQGLEQPIWRMHREITVPAAERPFAFCGIANPDEFFAALATPGRVFAGRARYRDHHFYSLADAHRLARRAAAANADCFFTTEKDSVRLTPDHFSILQRVAPVVPVRLQVELNDEGSVTAQLLSRLP